MDLNTYLWNKILTFYEHPLNKMMNDDLTYAYYIMDNEEGFPDFYTAFRRHIRYRRNVWFHSYHQCRQQISWSFDRARIISITTDDEN